MKKTLLRPSTGLKEGVVPPGGGGGTTWGRIYAKKDLLPPYFTAV